MSTQEFFAYTNRATHFAREIEMDNYSRSNTVCEGYIALLTEDEALTLRKDGYEVYIEPRKEGEICQDKK